MTVDEATESVDIWPDNVHAVNVFIAMSTQWRTGMAGATGLDYNALPAVMRLCFIPRAEWPHIFESIRVLEDIALETMRQNK